MRMLSADRIFAIPVLCLAMHAFAPFASAQVIDGEKRVTLLVGARSQYYNLRMAG
jgi:hypothetical protein